MLIFKALHILSMVIMITINNGGEFSYAFAIWRRDVRGLATLHRMELQSRTGFVGLGALLAGIGFGLLAAATGGLDFFAGWLIAAYVLVAAFFGNIALSARDLLGLAEKAIEADEGKRPTEEVARDMASSSAVRFFLVNAAIFAAIILDMVLKPF